MRELNEFLQRSFVEAKKINGQIKPMPKKINLEDPTDCLAVWKALNGSFSPENLHEDGELGVVEVGRKEKELIKIAKQMRDRSGPMPEEVAQWWEGPEHLTKGKKS